jgi:hypothetical protein
MLDNCGALAGSSAPTALTGRNSVACQSPIVIVPVLSSSGMFTSPAAGKLAERPGEDVQPKQPKRS